METFTVQIVFAQNKFEKHKNLCESRVIAM